MKCYAMTHICKIIKIVEYLDDFIKKGQTFFRMIISAKYDSAL
jgi:hypothetical protein